MITNPASQYESETDAGDLGAKGPWFYVWAWGQEFRPHRGMPPILGPVPNGTKRIWYHHRPDLLAYPLAELADSPGIKDLLRRRPDLGGEAEMREHFRLMAEIQSKDGLEWVDHGTAFLLKEEAEVVAKRHGGHVMAKEYEDSTPRCCNCGSVSYRCSCR